MLLRSGFYYKGVKTKPEPEKVRKRFDNVSSNHLALYLPQDPSEFDNLSAGGYDEEASQGYRLGLIKQKLSERVPTLDTLIEQTQLSGQHLSKPMLAECKPLMKAIAQGNSSLALVEFKKMLKHPIMQLLLRVHNQTYLEDLITSCSDAQPDVPSFLYPHNRDCLIKRDTFAQLITDFILTVSNVSTITLSIGLPTHHAYYEGANGFCLLNKTAMMVYYLHQNNSENKPVPFIIGLDVNRDDGLNDILCRDKKMPFIHVDVCDPRVYPYHSTRQVRGLMKEQGFAWRQLGAAHVFTRGNQAYHLIDLSGFRERNKHYLHPALTYIQKLMMDTLEFGQPITLITPIGYDACNLETAPCANYFAHKKTTMKEQNKQYQRFTMNDYADMFDWLIRQTTNSDLVTGLYYSLEGGYTSEVYVQLVVDLVNKAVKSVPVLAVDDEQEYDANFSP